MRRLAWGMTLLVGGDDYVFYLSAAIKVEAEARTWVSQTDEYKKRA
jgi:hypothetical protein